MSVMMRPGYREGGMGRSLERSCQKTVEELLWGLAVGLARVWWSGDGTKEK